jgi:hypothetical protein
MPAFHYLANDGSTKSTKAFVTGTRECEPGHKNLRVLVPDDGDEKAGLTGDWAGRLNVGIGTVAGSFSP